MVQYFRTRSAAVARLVLLASIIGSLFFGSAGSHPAAAACASGITTDALLDSAIIAGNSNHSATPTLIDLTGCGPITLNGTLNTGVPWSPGSGPYDGPGPTALTPITGNVTIFSNLSGAATKLTRNSANPFRIFSVKSGGTLTLINVQVDNGLAQGGNGGGGAGLTGGGGGGSGGSGGDGDNVSATGGGGGGTLTGGGYGGGGGNGGINGGGNGVGSGGSFGGGGGGADGSGASSGGGGGFGGGGGGGGGGGQGGFGGGNGVGGGGGGAGFGGAVFVNNGGRLNAYQVTFSGNQAVGGSGSTGGSGGGGAGDGAAVFNAGTYCAPALDNNTYSNDTATGGAGNGYRNGAANAGNDPTDPTKPVYTLASTVNADAAGTTQVTAGTTTTNCFPPTITLSPSSLPNGTVNSAYSQTLSASGGYGSYSFAGSGLPTWLTLSSTGGLSGTPTTPGPYLFHVVATDAVGFSSASTQYTITAQVVATKLVFTTQPSDTTAGLSISPNVQVTAEDGSGNIDTTFTGAVTIAIGNNAGPGGTLSGTLTQTASVGVATFSGLSINKAGSGYTLSASANSGSLTGTSAAFNITAAAPSQLIVVQQPISTTAATTINPVKVAIEDSFGNLTNSTASVTIAIGTNAGASPGGTLSGTLTQAASGGIATFSDLSIDKVGTGYTLTAASNGLTSATSSPFNIANGAAGKLIFVQQPTNAVSTTVISPAITVAIQDNSGNTISSSTAPVTVAISANAGSGTLSGTLTINAVAGIATFNNLSIDKIGTGYTLKASSATVQDATSSAFNITLGAASKLGFVQQPSNTTVSTAITPAVTVAIQDNGGNTITTSTANVTLAIAANPSSGTLSGTVTVSAVNGVATFSGLSIDKAGSGYTLKASSATVQDATSSPFTIGAPAPLPAVLPTTCITLGYQANNKVRLYVPGSETTSNNVPVVICYGLLTDPAQVGVTQPFALAVDVLAFTSANTSVGTLAQPVEVCLQGSGVLLFRDATQSPRVTTTLNAFSDGGFSCARIPNAGTVILIPGAAAPSGSVGNTIPSHPLTTCLVTTLFGLNLHSAPDAASSKVGFGVPVGVTLSATARAGDWVQVSYGSVTGWLLIPNDLSLSLDCN